MVKILRLFKKRKIKTKNYLSFQFCGIRSINPKHRLLDLDIRIDHLFDKRWFLGEK